MLDRPNWRPVTAGEDSSLPSLSMNHPGYGKGYTGSNKFFSIRVPRVLFPSPLQIASSPRAISMRSGDLIADRFEVEMLAGAGAVGQVFRAHDRITGGYVALKVLKPSEAHDTERFAREARVLSRLSHPAIVRFVASGATPDGEPFFAMEWLDGEDLAARLARAPLSVAEAVAFGRLVAEALAAAHVHGIVHRDIKPSNLFLCGGRLDVLKLLDFGLAWHEGAGVDLTRSGLVVGTLGYMAPEQAQGEREIDARTDVFALGCVIHRSVARRAPFESDRIGALLMKLLHEEAPRLSSLARGVPPALDDLLARMLAKDPAERPADGAAVARELAELEAQLPAVTASRPPPPMVAAQPGKAFASFVAVGAQQDWLSPSAAGLFVVFDPKPEVRERVRRVAAQHGGTMDALADGSLLVTLSGGVRPFELAARAARCALAIHALLPGAPIAATVARGEPSSRGATSRAIEAASELLGATAGRVVPEGARRPVRIDAACARLLGATFDVETDELGLALTGEHAERPLLPRRAG